MIHLPHLNWKNSSREHNNDDGLMELADLIQDEFRDGTFKTRSTCSFYPLNDNSQFVLKMILNDSLTGKVDFLSSKFMMKNDQTLYGDLDGVFTDSEDG